MSWRTFSKCCQCLALTCLRWPNNSSDLARNAVHFTSSTGVRTASHPQPLSVQSSPVYFYLRSDTQCRPLSSWALLRHAAPPHPTPRPHVCRWIMTIGAHYNELWPLPQTVCFLVTPFSLRLLFGATTPHLGAACVFRCITEQQCISSCIQDVAPVSIVVLLSKFTFENWHSMGLWEGYVGRNLGE